MKPGTLRTLVALLEAGEDGCCAPATKATSTSAGSAVKIAVLQRGWVYVGRFSRDGDDCLLTDAACVRVWGTTRGLGEIAANGPTAKTVLDPCPDVRFHILTAVLILDVEDEKWASR